MAAPNPLQIKLKLVCGSEGAFGPGRADLLEAIDRCGSISAAARDIGMSYRRAWLLVDATNRCWSDPLVIAKAGGGGARGARLTDCGREVLAAYRALQATLAAASADDPALKVLTSRLLPAPREPAS